MKHNFIYIRRLSYSIPNNIGPKCAIFCKKSLRTFKVHTKTDDNKKSIIKVIDKYKLSKIERFFAIISKTRLKQKNAWGKPTLKKKIYKLFCNQFFFKMYNLKVVN